MTVGAHNGHYIKHTAAFISPTERLDCSGGLVNTEAIGALLQDTLCTLICNLSI